METDSRKFLVLALVTVQIAMLGFMVAQTALSDMTPDERALSWAFLGVFGLIAAPFLIPATWLATRGLRLGLALALASAPCVLGLGVSLLLG